MRFRRVIIAFIIAALTLSGCGTRSSTDTAVSPDIPDAVESPTPSQPPDETAPAETTTLPDGTELVISQHNESEFNSTDFILETEHPVYSKDIDLIIYTITNQTEKEAMYGAEFAIEIQIGRNWYVCPFIDHFGWAMMGMSLFAGETRAGGVNTEVLRHELIDGSYRIIKEISDVLYCAEFEIGDSTISAETPFGFAPLDSLPSDYSITQAIENGDYVIAENEVYNAEKLQQFIDNIGLSIRSCLRFTTLTTDGEVIVTDYIFNHNSRGRFRILHDTTRATGGSGVIEEYAYSYLSIKEISGTEYLCFSNYASLTAYAPEGFENYWILPCKPSPEVLDSVRKIINWEVEYGYGKYCSLSPDFVREINLDLLSDSTEYMYSSYWGSMLATAEDPENMLQKLDMAYWLSNDSFVLVGTTTNGGVYAATYIIEEKPSAGEKIVLVSCEYR